ncbi:unnamed protein product [Lepeophtheirus salmonis]|uniref:(salmon louse) hypothetical protein n=1 Tax=Lepeophtheirus salmonis TaxID=72036 RepID=A0A7R8CKM8_LEPSM|nr:unnamed protein product [Lepeophtheirus salmonis]CAF2849839.1 unnamed protein product [Lepeophtheirus salmonis]
MKKIRWESCRMILKSLKSMTTPSLKFFSNDFLSVDLPSKITVGWPTRRQMSHPRSGQKNPASNMVLGIINSDFDTMINFINQVERLNGIAPGDFRSCSKETNKEGIPLCKGIWEDCGSLFEITDVQIQTFRRPRHNKIPLFHGSRTRICITGIARNINTPVEAIQNSAHGEILTVKNEFCDIPKDGCGGMKNGCPIQSGDEFNYCSVLHVPDITVQLDVDVFWRVIAKGTSNYACTIENMASHLKTNPWTLTHLTKISLYI